MITKLLIEKYNLAPNKYYQKGFNPYSATEPHYKIQEGIFNEKEKELRYKYQDKVEDGWYGISLGWPTPILWLTVLDEFLEYLFKQNPEAKILQQKIKLGYYTGYFRGLTESEQQEVHELQKVLFDKALIY